MNSCMYVCVWEREKGWKRIIINNRLGFYKHVAFSALTLAWLPIPSYYYKQHFSAKHVLRLKKYNILMGFLWGSDSKESACNAGDLNSIPGLGRFPWMRAWQPSLVFLPGGSHGQRNLAGYNSWGRKESDTTEWLRTAQHVHFNIYLYYIEHIL